MVIKYNPKSANSILEAVMEASFIGGEVNFDSVAVKKNKDLRKLWSSKRNGFPLCLLLPKKKERALHIAIYDKFYKLDKEKYRILSRLLYSKLPEEQDVSLLAELVKYGEEILNSRWANK